MSTTIDERILSMKFDNKQFENGVQTSLNSLNTLNKSLNMTEGTKGLENVGKAANGINLSTLTNGVSNLGLKFSSMQVMAVTALANITNSAVNAGKKISNALTIEPIKTGFQEYETQINAVQTILANTQSKGSTLSDVNSALDELNTYADKTIYNFTEMTRNIGTFTAAGVDLDKSVTSIKGIANLAAVSGSTSQQASTAMYQLSQALAAGKVQLMDWNSVVNAGMGGQVFQDALKRTATQMGTNVDALIKKYGSFKESLTKGEWLTSEVLTETLTQLSGAYSEADLIAQGYSKKQAKEIVELANTAEGAAIDVKTFTQLVDTLKEAAQSGWTQTWELIVGDFGQAKKLWTDVSNVVGDFINSSAEARNKLLSGTLLSGWDQLMSAGIIDEKAYKKTIKAVASDHGVSLDKMIKKEGSFNKALTSGLKSGKITSDMLSESVGKLTKKVNGMSKEERDAAGYTAEQVKSLRKLNKGLKDGSISMEDFTEKMTKASGRQLLIKSLINIFHGLLSIIKPIKEAFREIFPPTTSDQLYDMIKNFKELTDKFKLSKDQANQVKAVFKGVFSVIDMGIMFIKEIVVGIGQLISNFTGLGGSALKAASSFGKWLSGLRDSAKETNLFGTVIGKIIGVLQKVINKIKEFIGFLKEKIEFPSLEGFLSIMDSIWSIITKVGSKITAISSKIGKSLGDIFTVENIGTGLDFANAGLFGGVLYSISNFFNTAGKSVSNLGGITSELKGVFGSVKSAFNGVKNVLDETRNCLETWQKNLKANILLKIAGAIAILAASIVVISMIKPEKLSSSLGAVTVMFGDLMGSLAIFNKMDGKFSGATKAARMMMAVSFAVLILAEALKTISSIDPKTLGTSLLSVMALMYGMVGVMVLLSKYAKEGAKGAGQMILFSVSVKILASAVKDLAQLKPNELIKGLIGVGALLGEIVGFTKLMGKGEGLISSGLGMILIASSMKIFTSAIGNMAQFDIEQLKKGLGTIGILLLEIAGFTRIMGSGGSLIAAGVGLILMSSSMKIFASTINDIAQLNPEELKQGLIGIGGVLAEILAFSKLTGGAGKLIGIGIGMVIVANAITTLSNALNIMGSMGWEAIEVGLTALGGSLIILSLALYAMRGSLAGSAALLIAAGALAILAPVLQLLGSMSIESIGKSLLALGGVFVVLGIAGYALGPVVPVILALSASLALLGVGCLAIGAGISLVAVGLTLLATSVAGSATAIVAALAVIISGLINLIPVIVSGFGEALVSIAKVIADVAPTVVTSLLKALTLILEVIAKFLPRILKATMKIIITVLKAIRDYIPEIIKVGAEIVVNFINGIASKIGDIVDAAFNLIISFIEGLANAIEKNKDRMIDAVGKLFMAIIDTAKTILLKAVGVIKKLGEKIMKSGFIQGIKDKISNAVDTVKSIPKKCIDKIKEKISDFKDAGKDTINGFIDGIKDKINAVGDAASAVGKKALNSIKDFLGINSPSREFKKVGIFSDDGVIAGLKTGSKNVALAAGRVGKTAINSMKNSLSGLSDAINTDIDSQPTIRPVLDLSDVSNGAGVINDMFDMQPSVGVMSNLRAINSSMNDRQNGNSELLSAVKGLRKDFANSNGGVTVDVHLDYNAGSDANEIANDIATSLRRAIRRGV